MAATTPRSAVRRAGVDVTTEHASPDGAWLHVRPRGAGLRSLRRVAVAVHGYRHALARPAPHRVTPSIDAGIVLSLGPMSTVVEPDATHTGLVASVAPRGDRPRTVEASSFHGLQVDVNPLALPALLGASACELGTSTVDLHVLLGREVELLRERLVAAQDWNERFAVLDAAVASRLRRASRAARPDPRVAAYLSLLRRRPSTTVDAAARELGTSPRTLRRRTSAALGVGPKRLQRTARARSAVRRLTTTTAPLTDVAASLGYADQSHLTNELVELTGATPAALRREALPHDGGLFTRD